MPKRFVNAILMTVLSTACMAASSVGVWAQKPPSRAAILHQIDEVKKEKQEVTDDQVEVRDIALGGSGIIVGTLTLVEINEFLNRRFSQWYPPFLFPTIRISGATAAISAALLTPYRVMALRLRLQRVHKRLDQEQSDLENLLENMRFTN